MNEMNQMGKKSENLEYNRGSNACKMQQSSSETLDVHFNHNDAFIV